MKLIMVLYCEIKDKDEVPICGPSTMDVNSKNGILFYIRKVSQQRDPGVNVMEGPLDCLSRNVNEKRLIVSCY